MKPRKAKVDSNQKDIVDKLRSIPGVTVELGHDDILVGCYDKNFIPHTYWYEVKNPEYAKGKDGNILESAKKDSQKKLDKKWTGHRKTITTVDEILIDIGLK